MKFFQKICRFENEMKIIIFRFFPNDDKLDRKSNEFLNNKEETLDCREINRNDLSPNLKSEIPDENIIK